jgi:hypothetical protein
MNKKQENQYRMYLSVEKVCDENQQAYQTIPALASAIAALKANNLKITQVRVSQKTPTTGYTDQRDKIKKEMAELAFEIAGSVCAYAHVNGNEVLSKKVDFSFSELVYARDAVVKSRATVILNEANAVVSQLADYGATPELLQQLTQKMAEFDDIVGKKGYNKEETQTATEQISILLSQNSELLKNQIDKLMLKFKNTNADFYTNYFNAREIYNFGGGKKHQAPEEAPPKN